MIEGWLFGLTLVTALGCALSAGALFAFSAFVMRGLTRLPAAQGMAAMQSINVTAVTPPFMTALFGPALASVVLIVAAVVQWGDTGAVHLLVGSVLYLVGVIGLTGLYHVPRNNALAAVEPGSADAANRWARYVSEWTAWNHVRVAAGLAATATLIMGLAA
ncbi:MAG: DUF1772 domain-containing protein [Acidimicrobiales bacterium]